MWRVIASMWCQTRGVMIRQWTSKVFVLKLLKSFDDGGSVGGKYDKRTCGWRMLECGEI